jgi:hypothetical protein
MVDQRDVLAEFSHLRDVATQVADLIASARVHMISDCAGNSELELEARLGKIQGTHFDPNVGHAAFCSILQLLESYQRWARVQPWQESQDVFFTMELPAELTELGKTVSAQVRTSVEADASGEMHIKHITKRRLGNVDMEMQAMDAGSCALSISRDQVGGYDARVSASLEKAVPAEMLPLAVSPELVRIKQRKRFFLSSLGVESETFSFDLSIVYTGKSRSEAEYRQNHQIDPCFEVEIECLRPTQYLLSSGGEDIMLALSLILKCHDFSSALHTSSAVTYIPAAK